MFIIITFVISYSVLFLPAYSNHMLPYPALTIHVYNNNVCNILFCAISSCL